MRKCNICNNNNLTNIYTITLALINDLPLNNSISVLKCSICDFYFSDSNNNQFDYDKYYKCYNNYMFYPSYSDKDDKCSTFLIKELEKLSIHNILDYGSGNGKLSSLLSDTFKVDTYDINMNINILQYDCVILSHVLEHIYDLNNFILNIKDNIKDNGYLYIEVPNIDFYDKIADITPLQEINIEHINFFSNTTLIKLLSKYNLRLVYIADDYFTIKNNKYYIIRAIFQKNISNSLEKYIEEGNNIINNYNFSTLQKYDNIYIYGCGQFLFKILPYITNNTNVLYIIDDNSSYINKKISNIEIINFETYTDISKANDNILITTLIYDNLIKDKIYNFNKDIHCLTIKDL